jgi:hypothetical protein
MCGGSEEQIVSVLLDTAADVRSRSWAQVGQAITTGQEAAHADNQRGKGSGVTDNVGWHSARTSAATMAPGWGVACRLGGLSGGGCLG